MQFNKLVLMLGFILFLTSCHHHKEMIPDPYHIGLTPTPPKFYDNVPLENSLSAFTLASNLQPRANQVTSDDNANFVSLMMQNGSVLTIWALGLRNWLWGYPPVTTQYFGNIRNWKIERSLTKEHFRFINQQSKTCIEAYGNGLIHNLCNPHNLAQEFELLPTASGAIVLRNLAQQRCVTYNPVSTTDYTTITMKECNGESHPLNDQIWYLAPPLLDAVAEN